MALEKAFTHLWTHLRTYFTVFVAIVIGVAVLLGFSAANGTMVPLGIEFSGGTEIIAQVSSQDRGIFQSTIGRLSGESVAVREVTRGGEQWVSMETQTQLEQSQVRSALNTNNVTVNGLSIRTVGAAVSSSFFTEAMRAVAVAFGIMAAIIFIAFRTVIPSLAAIAAVITDVVIIIALMYVFAIPLTFGSLAALLMIIGYSVDTDILMSARVLRRREGTLFDRFYDSMTTGLTFSLASLSAFIVLALISTSTILDQIAFVIIFGLIGDIPATWIQNMWILQRYAVQKFQ